MHQSYNIDFCYIHKLSNELNLAILNLNDKKTKKYKILVALATCVLNWEYVITNYTCIIENSLMQRFDDGLNIKQWIIQVPYWVPILHF